MGAMCVAICLGSSSSIALLLYNGCVSDRQEVTMSCCIFLTYWYVFPSFTGATDQRPDLLLKRRLYLGK